MGVSALAAVLTGAVVVLGCTFADAAERLVVVRGGACPGGAGRVSVASEAGASASECLLLDPVVRGRFGFGGAFTAPAGLCRGRIPEIEGSGASLCVLARREPVDALARTAPASPRPAEPPRGPDHMAMRYAARIVSLSLRTAVAVFSVFYIVWRRDRILRRAGMARYCLYLSSAALAAAAMLALDVHLFPEVAAFVHRCASGLPA